MNGEDGSTHFPDQSDSQHTVTANGDAQVDTAEYVFATGSARFDGTGDYLTVPDSTDWAMGGSLYTIDLRFKATAFGSERTIINQGTAGNNYWKLSVNSSGATGWLLFEARSTGSGAQPTLDMTSTLISLNTWYHLALVKVSTLANFKVYLDGTLIGTVTTGDTMDDYASDLYIGRAAWANGLPFNGWIDELRVIKGSAVWSADFTPPCEPYDCPDESSSSSEADLLSSSSSTTNALVLSSSSSSSTAAELLSSSSSTVVGNCIELNDCTGNIALNDGAGCIELNNG
jgi:hypothetical protein